MKKMGGRACWSWAGQNRNRAIDRLGLSKGTAHAQRERGERQVGGGGLIGKGCTMWTDQTDMSEKRAATRRTCTYKESKGNATGNPQYDRIACIDRPLLPFLLLSHRQATASIFAFVCFSCYAAEVEMRIDRFDKDETMPGVPFRGVSFPSKRAVGPSWTLAWLWLKSGLKTRQKCASR
jgi:hypothetical protein